MKRIDGRKNNELRPIQASVNVIKNADGSAMFKIGDTIALAAVYGPRGLFPKFLQDPNKGVLRCNYNMIAFSGVGDRVKPGPNRRARELGLVIEKALLPSIDLTDFPRTVVDVFIELIQTDAGTRCAGICAASLALAHAGFKLKDLVSAVSVGYINDELLLDINSYEDCNLKATDMPVAFMPRTNKITLLQLDGKLTQAQIKAGLELAKEGCKKIYEEQRRALREAYKGVIEK